VAIADEVTARYSTQFLAQLTNPDATDNPTTVDTTYLGKATTDAQSRFKKIVDKTYDNTDADHVATIVETVVVVLMERAERWAGFIDKRREANDADLKALANITARDRIIPKSTSILETSSEDTAGVTDRPSFDSKRFDDITPDDPEATS
jgi:hypothetical protein